MSLYDDSTKSISNTREIRGHTSAVNAVRFTRDGNYLLSVSDDR
jgi:WD40 repeat protein